MYTETELVDNFINKVNPIVSFGIESSFIKEVDTPVGIPDIIMIEKNQFYDLDCFTSKFPTEIFTNRNAKVLSVLSKKFHSKQYILKKCNLNIEILEKILKRLLDYSIIESNSSNCYRFKNDFNIPQIDIWSFEFKLNDWRRALRQSLVYRSFCNFPVVIMPEKKRCLLTKNKMYFERFKIGLGVVNYKSNKVSFIVKPKKYKNISKNLYIDAIGRIAIKRKQDLICN